MAKLEALYTTKPILCRNGFHEPPILVNGYYEFSVEERQARFWKFLSPTEKSRMMNEYHETGKCLLCSIDEALVL